MLTAETNTLDDKYNLAYFGKTTGGFTVVTKDRDMSGGSSVVFTAPFGMSLKDLGFDYLCVRNGVIFCHGSVAADGTILS